MLGGGRFHFTLHIESSDNYVNYVPIYNIVQGVSYGGTVNFFVAISYRVPECFVTLILMAS